MQSLFCEAPPRGVASQLSGIPRDQHGWGELNQARRSSCEVCRRGSTKVCARVYAEVGTEEEADRLVQVVAGSVLKGHGEGDRPEVYDGATRPHQSGRHALTS